MIDATGIESGFKSEVLVTLIENALDGVALAWPSFLQTMSKSLPEVSMSARQRRTSRSWRRAER
jgi:hypothetical protein